MNNKFKKYSNSKIFKINFFKKNKFISFNKKKNKFYKKKSIIISFKKKKINKLGERLTISLALKFLKFYYGNLIKKKLKKLMLKKKLSYKIIYSLEYRLDMIVYRMQYALSIFQSQNIIKNGFILVNKNIIKYNKYKINIKDFISINIMKKSLVYKIILYNYKYYKTNVPNYLEINLSSLEGKILFNPHIKQIPVKGYLPYKLLLSTTELNIK